MLRLDTVVTLPPPSSKASSQRYKYQKYKLITYYIFLYLISSYNYNIEKLEKIDPNVAILIYASLVDI